MRAMAGLCQDELYMAMFEPGKDMHAEIAAMMGIPRDGAKPFNHGANYGLGAKALILQGQLREEQEKRATLTALVMAVMALLVLFQAAQLLMVEEEEVVMMAHKCPAVTEEEDTVMGALR